MSFLAGVAFGLAAIFVLPVVLISVPVIYGKVFRNDR